MKLVTLDVLSIIHSFQKPLQYEKVRAGKNLTIIDNSSIYKDRLRILSLKSITVKCYID